MKRREFITLLGGAAATWPFAARAQQGNGIRLIGVLMGIETIQRGGHKSTPFGRGLRSSGGLRDAISGSSIDGALGTPTLCSPTQQRLLD